MQIRHNMVNCYVARTTADRDWEFLQIRRAKNDFMGGTWQTVYGQAEPHETAPQAILRELKEETGLTPTELYRLERVMVFYTIPHDTIWHSVQFCAIISPTAQIKLNEEHDALRWLPAATAQSQFMWEEDRRSVKECIKEILGNGPAKPFVKVEIP
jgi:8-oxo-dGTP pyrophosphatase MutT (NUDIX family)